MTSRSGRPSASVAGPLGWVPEPQLGPRPAVRRDAEQVGDEVGIAPRVVLDDAGDGLHRRERRAMDLGNRRAAAVVGARMRHPRRATILLVLPLLALAACGDDSPIDDAAATLPPVVTAGADGPADGPADRPADGARDDRRRHRPSYPVATGADDVVISVTNEGGFVPAGFAFANAADRPRHRRRPGAVDRPGRGDLPRPAAAEHPAALDHARRPCSSCWPTADELGLLADVAYEDPTT